MQKSFAIGAATGAASLLVAVPMLAQLAGAANFTAATPVDFLKDRPVPTQTCIEAMATQETKSLSTMDAVTAAHKAASTAHRDALLAAAKITDETTRGEALKAAHEAMRTAMEAAMQKTDMQADMDAMKAACGDSMPMHGFMMATPAMGGKMKMRGGHFKMMKFKGANGTAGVSVSAE